MFSGPYMITSVNHSISPGSFETIIEGIRQPTASLPKIDNYLQTLKTNLLQSIIEKNKLDIFYLIVGARVHNIDEKMLQRLKETGCIEIGYGQESGSDRILKEYYKGVTSQQNKKVTLLTTKKIGIHSPVQLVIGAPGETSETIKENIQFLKDLEAYTYSLNYLIPLPETPIWKQVESNGLVPDLEEYLDLVAEHGGMPLVNLTKVHDNEWGKWSIQIKKEIQLYR